MPSAQRVDPPYAQIANHYRRQILDGALSEGDRLPAFAEIGKEWGVSVSTVARGIGQLAIEGYVRVLARGTFVEPLRHGSDTPRDRIARVRSARAMPTGDMEVVRFAEQIRAPAYVADLMDLDPSGQVIRREWVTCAGRLPLAEPVALHVAWYPPQLAELVPELLATKPIPGGAIKLIEGASGQTVTHGEDHFHGRASDAREASALGIPIGAAILAGAYLWTTDDGTVLEYGEFCLPERRTLRYDYNPGAD
jgi:GntR family transcriptional regulator